MNAISCSVVGFFVVACGAISAFAADTHLVRETEALTPAQESAALHVPEGFEIQLFASEPMINKPINMAFDSRGRLWVSSTVEYPYCADKSRWSDAQGTRVKDSRDAIKILEDTDGDGKADKVIDFADGLNIPTGVVPWHKPEHKSGCIAWSIPNIWYFADTDGDGKADLREVVFGPLGYEKDTHGMCSSFRLGLDGWIYATHGFSNTSHFKAKDGSMLDLHSGNVFRFRPDGSRVEPWTHGQVNPFGLCWDRYGNLYSADCHSAPVYQLIRGAHYPSFGKPHDGLGHAPVMCEHTHGSTGICGIAYIDGGVWGPEWDDHMFVGNVVTSKVNHDHVTFTGSTPKANEKPDFITSDDPWFRPVDIQLGPDNALYIADFYNRIIGHYEVPLEHPGRDKERGRIWRVVKKGVQRPPVDLTSMEAEQITETLGHANLTRRHLALQEVQLRGTKDWLKFLLPCIDPLGSMQPVGDIVATKYIGENAPKFPDDAGDGARYKASMQAAYALWACSYLGERYNIYRVHRGLLNGSEWLNEPDAGGRDYAGIDSRVGQRGLIQFNKRDGTDYSSNQQGLLIAQTTQILGSYDRLHPWEKWSLGLAFERRTSLGGRSVCQALLNRADFLQEEPRWQAWQIEMLMKLTDRVMADPKESKPKATHVGDTHFAHAVRVLLRDFLSQPGVLKNQLWHERTGIERNAPWFLELVRTVPTAEAASFLLAEPHARFDSANWKHMARYAEAEKLPAVVQIAHEHASFSTERSSAFLQAISDGLSERGAPANPALRTWAQELATKLLEEVSQQPVASWESVAQTGATPAWSLVARKCTDGTETQVLQSMMKGGDEESRRGILTSKSFPVPAKLTFWINGHRGFANAPAHDKNLVRLVEAKSGAVLASAFPPRKDSCELVEWDLSEHVGKQARLEIVDGDDGKAYAWLGMARITPAVVNVEDFERENQTRAALRNLAEMLQHTAPAALREKLATYLPARPAPPPLPISSEQRQQLDALIAARSAAFAKAKPDLAAGEKIFAANCAACHRIGGKGGLIGPQLDGIGTRGVERLCEDILDPNRNVDAHFHLHTLTMKDGSVMSGFLKGEAGQVLILADAAGQEHRVSKTDLTKDDVMPMSLMPPAFGQIIPEADFASLLGWLLGK